MTNQTLESAQPVSPAGTPTPAGGAASGQPTSPSPVVFTPEQVEYLKPFIEQQAQSTKDRRIAELERAVNELRTGIAQPTQTPSVTTPSAQAASPANGVTQAAQPTVEYEKVIQAIGLDANDREVWRLAGQHGGNEAAFTHALVNLKIARANQPPPSASVMPPSPSAGQAPTDNLDTKTARLAELQKNPRQNRVEMEALIKEIDASGALR